MEHQSKKRRLAPKLADKHAQDQVPDPRRFDYHYPPPPPPPHDAPQPPPAEPATDFDAFARHLQDAAVTLYAQAHRSRYASVSVLLLRWDDDHAAEPELLALQKVFVERYNFRTECWKIPTSAPNPGVKLSLQMAQHVEYARPDHLLIVYYAGYGFVGLDHHVYWACHSRDDSPRLKWDTIRCLIEDAQCDLLLLLDSCAVVDGPTAGGHGIKQGIAAYGRDAMHDISPRSFTSTLIDALQKLGAGPPFTVPRLYEELVAQRHQQLQELPRPRGPHATPNGTKKSSSLDKMPVSFNLTVGNLQSIVLAPGARHARMSPTGSPDGEVHRTANGEYNDGADVLFDDVRALVRISVPGEPTQDMYSFKRWLSETAASKIHVEGVFHGPPAIILASMPVSIFQTLCQSMSSDRAPSFLGYVKSHNVLGDYQKLVSQSPVSKPSARELEDGRILLEAAGANVFPSVRSEPPSMPVSTGMMFTAPPLLMPDRQIDRKDDVEESDEMTEAAIQLKALSYTRHHNQENMLPEHSLPHPTPLLPPEESPGHASIREDSISSHDPNDSAEDNMYNSEYNSPVSSRSKPRRTIQKQGPKQDTSCSLCSHAPFKDSSSLRKHIAAAHTRPFPCAFAFAGCMSTFGSKNEWKRHIASQHLCLTYYRCSSCPQSAVEGKGNEFNRKDLFTQHLRRMHAPFAIKKALAKGDSKLQQEWEGHVKEMQTTCLVVRRSPPQRSACPKADCANVFEGGNSWDDWTEHVGRHMEKGEAGRLGVDRLLAKWALDEGIIERKDDGEYRLCGAERDGSLPNNGYYSDGGGGGLGGAAVKREGDDGADDAALMEEPPR